MPDTRAIAVLVVVVTVALLVGCPPRQPASQTDDVSSAGAAKTEPGAPKAAAAEQPAPAASDSGDDVAQLYETKCAKCHPLSAVEGRTDTPEGWEKTVKAMQAKDTAWISDAEAEKIAALLAEKYPRK